MVIQLPSNLRILGKGSERRNELKDGRENSDRENERIHNEFDVKWCKNVWSMCWWGEVSEYWIVWTDNNVIVKVKAEALLSEGPGHSSKNPRLSSSQHNL